MNAPQPPPPPMKSIEELTRLNQHLVEHVAPLFAWPADSLVTLFSSWVAYGGQAQAAGNTAEYERALRWASDNYDQTLALALAAVPSYHSTAQASTTAATSATESVLASEPEQVRLPADESVSAPAGTPPQAIADEVGTPAAVTQTEVDATTESTTTTQASALPLTPSTPRADDGELSPGTVVLVTVDSIVIDEDRRAKADQEHVEELAKSIRVVGLQNAPVVTPGGRLVSGLHRVLACRFLGLAEIRVSVVDLTGLQERIAFIDENLVRRDLPALERAELIAERKQLYEQAHPETAQYRRGGEAKAAGGATAIDAVAPAFATETARLTGRSERSIRQDGQVAKLPQSVRDAIRGTEVAAHITELEKLARLGADDQVAVANVLKDGRATKIAQALGIVKTKGAAPSGTGSRERGPGATEPTYVDSQRSTLIAQRTLLRKTVATLKAPLDEWRGDYKKEMSPYIRIIKPVVEAIETAIVAMQENARSDPEFWGEPVPAPASTAAKPTTRGLPAKKKSKPGPSSRAAKPTAGVPPTRKPKPHASAKSNGGRKRSRYKKRKAA